MRITTLASGLLALCLSVLLSSTANAQIVAEINPTYAETASPGGTAGPGYPMNTWYHDMRIESIYTVAELTAAGLYPGAIINQVHLKCSEVPGQTLANFRIRMTHSASATHSGIYQVATALTNCYGPSNHPVTEFTPTQWKAFTLTTPFTWNGTANLMIDFTQDDTSYTPTGGGGIYMRTTPGIRTLRGWSDSGYTFPFDGMTNGATGSQVPSLRLAFPPPQLTVYLNNPPNPRENVPYSAQATALESPAFLPYTWTLTPLTNANWLSINPATGQLTGTPPSFSAGPVTFQLTVANSRPAGVQTDTKNFSLTVIGIPNLIPQYTDNFNTPSLIEQYDILLGSKAGAVMKTAAASGTTGSGLRLSGNQATGLFDPIDLSNTAHRALLDNPGQWEGGGIVNPSDFVGKAELITRAPGVFSVNVSFQYRIIQTGSTPSAAFAAYQNNMVFEWSYDGVTWNIASGPSALPNGIYRTPTSTSASVPGAFTTEAFTVSGLSGSSSQMLRFRFRWLCRLKDDASSIQTYIDIDNLSLVVPFTITTLDVPSATANVPYAYENGNIQLVQVSGAAPVTWGATGKPGWMNINASTGVITGMPGPADVGTFPVTFTATDSTLTVATRPVSFVVKPAPSAVAITNLATLPEASEGVLYQYSLSAFGGAPVPGGVAQPRYFWSIATTPESAWLSVDPSTGLLSGTPPLGTFGSTVSFSATVRDGLYLLPGGTASNTATKTFYISIVERLTIVTADLALAMQGTSLRPVLEAAGGVEPYTWQILSGQLPMGVVFEPTTGRIVGVPFTSEAPASYPLVIQVSDAGIQSAIVNLTLIVQPAATTTNLGITTTVLDPANATETQSFETWLDAAGGVPPYSWSIPVTSADQLPPGLTLDANGRISGSPFSGTARPYAIDLRITDSSAVPQVVTQTFNLTVESLISPPAITTSVLQDAEVGLTYPSTLPFAPPNINAPALRVVGGVPPFSWQMTAGTLPEGMVFTSVGLITGVPMSGAEADSPYTISVRVTDGLGNTDSRTYQLTVNAYSGAALAFVNTQFPAATTGAPYSFRITATGGANPTGSTLPYLFRKVSGQLPVGLDFDPFGQVRGTPISGSGGEYPLVLEVKDAANFTAQTTMVLSVVDAGGGSLTTGGGTTVVVPLTGSGSGCTVGGTGPNGAVWLVLLSVLGGVAVLRRRRA